MKSAVKLNKLVTHNHFKTQFASEFDIRMTLKFMGLKGTDVSIKKNRYSQTLYTATTWKTIHQCCTQSLFLWS